MFEAGFKLFSKTFDNIWWVIAENSALIYEALIAKLGWSFI